MKLLLIATFLAAVAAPEPEIRYFRYERPVSIPQGALGQACVVLDENTFAHAAAGNDIRLYRGTVETPYVIRGEQARKVAQGVIEPVNLGRRKGKTVFDVAMPSGDYGDLQLNISGQDFLATVSVSGSQTVSGPVTEIGNYTVFDFTSQHLGRSTVLHLPRSNYPYLHFAIDSSIAPARIGNFDALPFASGAARYLALSSVELNRKGEASVAEFTLPANVPVERIAFTVGADAENFNRSVEVQATEMPAVKDDANPPRSATVASGYVLRIHQEEGRRRVDEEHLALDALAVFGSPTRWTVTVHNGDDAPVRFTSVQAQMLQRSLCFEAAAGAAYTLYYGDRALAAPRYDYASWFARQPNAVVGTLGAEAANPSYEPRPDARPFTERHPALLWIVLVVVVLGLGAVALRSGRRVNQNPQTPRE